MPQDRRPVFTLQKVNWRVSLPVFPDLPLSLFPSLLRSDSLLILAVFSPPLIIYTVPLPPLSSPVIHRVFAWLPSSGTPVSTPEAVGVRYEASNPVISLSPRFLPYLLPPSFLLIIDDRWHFKAHPWNRSFTVSIIRCIQTCFYPLMLHTPLQNSYNIQYIFKSAYSPILFTLVCDVSDVSYSLPHPYPPYLCPYLSSGTFQSHPSFSVIDFFILSMSGLPPPLPLSLPHLFILSCILILHLIPTHPLFFPRVPQACLFTLG